MSSEFRGQWARSWIQRKERKFKRHINSPWKIVLCNCDGSDSVNTALLWVPLQAKKTQRGRSKYVHNLEGKLERNVGALDI